MDSTLKKSLVAARKFIRKNRKCVLLWGVAVLGLGMIVSLFFLLRPLVWDEGFRNPFARETVVLPPTFLKIGFVNDWEYGSRKRVNHKLTSQASVELRKAVDYLNNEFKPDLVVGGGDYIESSAVKKEKAKDQLREVNDIFKTLAAPRLYALGNHDMRSLTKAEVREILEMPDNHAVSDMGDWRIVVLDTNFNKEDGSDRSEKSYVTGYVSGAELSWLRQALDTDRPVIVFSHHSPLSVPDIAGTSWVRNITNEEALRSILEERGNVVAVVSGHNPRNYYEERNGIHYFVVDTLVNEPALGSFTTIELSYLRSDRYAEMVLEQHGIRPDQHIVDWQYEEKERDILPDPIRQSEPESEDEVLEWYE
ncbi:MAG: metallophosphoesterase [Candidatus Moranbacteria bacterium]|nr:metallophosphoesterase [Candidatus Moranbacteria bacterium]